MKVTFELVLYIDSGSLFTFPHHCRIEHVWRFSHWPLFTKLDGMTDADKGMNPLHFGISPGNPDSNPR